MEQIEYLFRLAELKTHLAQVYAILGSGNATRQFLTDAEELVKEIENWKP